MTATSISHSRSLAAAILSLSFLAIGCDIVADDKKSSSKEEDAASDAADGDNTDAGQTDAAGADGGTADTEEGETETTDIDAIKTNLTIVEKVAVDLGITTIDDKSSLVMVPPSASDTAVRRAALIYTNTKTKEVRCAKLAIAIYPGPFAELAAGEWQVFSPAALEEILTPGSKSKAAGFLIGNLPEEGCNGSYTGEGTKSPSHVEWSAYSGKAEVLGFSTDKDGRKTVVLRYIGLKLRSEDNHISGANDGDLANDGDVEDETVYVDELEISGTLVVEEDVREKVGSNEPDAAP